MWGARTERGADVEWPRMSRTVIVGAESCGPVDLHPMDGLSGGSVDNQTLTIHVGDIFNLDTGLWRAQAEGRIRIGGTQHPKQAFARSVLLAANGPALSGENAAPLVYFLVGVLRGVERVGPDRWVKFESLERFAVPVAVSSEAEDVRAVHLLGEKQGWGPTGFYYLRPGAANEACAAARDLAVPRKGNAESEAKSSIEHQQRNAGPAEAGVHRVHLQTTDGDALTTYLPLDGDGRLLRDGVQPWLVKATFGSDLWLGELQWREGWNRVTWHHDVPDSITDLGTVPVRLGETVMLHDGDTEDTEAWEYVVRNVRRV